MGIMEVMPSHDKKLHNSVWFNFSSTQCAELSLFSTCPEISCFAIIQEIPCHLPPSSHEIS